MKSFWLFRTNLKQLEYYHKYIDLEEFKQKCHDFYLLQGIWFLENNVFDEIIIWRLVPGKETCFKKEIIFEVNGKQFIQRFVDRFEDCFNYLPRPTVTFFRGGFPEYGKLTRMRTEFFGLTLYCGTGQRVYPEHGGIYNKILVEDNRDIAVRNSNTVPFYKTANMQIFKPLIVGQKYDICWPCNFSQLRYKGQEWFIKEVGESTYLQGLKILHVGNKSEIGKKLCQKYKVSNIEFVGYVSRPNLNVLLNQSKLGLVTSNLSDGCPRIVTEIMASGIPLLLRDKTRASFYYCKDTIVFNSYNIESKIKIAMIKHEVLNKKAIMELEKLSMDKICKRNLVHWGNYEKS